MHHPPSTPTAILSSDIDYFALRALSSLFGTFLFSIKHSFTLAMGFMHMFGRRASSNAATAIVQPVTPQKTAVTSKSSPGSQPSAAKRVRTKIGKKLAAFSLRRHDGVTTVTVNKEHYMPSLQDSGYASGYIEQVSTLKPSCKPVIMLTASLRFVHRLP